MKITVISDSHGFAERMQTVVEHNKDSDLFIHLGDGIEEAMEIADLFPEKQFALVKGNSDYINYMEENIIEAGRHKIYAAHGHKHNVYHSHNLLIHYAAAKQCRIALYGHTHIHRIEYDEIGDIHIMNPGSVTRPRGGNRPTYGIITISGDGKINMEIKNYGS